MGKIQKEPGSMPKGLEFSYNGKSGMIPNYVTTPLNGRMTMKKSGTEDTQSKASV